MAIKPWATNPLFCGPLQRNWDGQHCHSGRGRGGCGRGGCGAKVIDPNHGGGGGGEWFSLWVGPVEDIQITVEALLG